MGSKMAKEELPTTNESALIKVEEARARFALIRDIAKEQPIRSLVAIGCMLRMSSGGDIELPALDRGSN
jgi:hypothetical protein